MATPGYDGTPPASPQSKPDGTKIVVRVDSTGGVYIEKKTRGREAAMTKPPEG